MAVDRVYDDERGHQAIGAKGRVISISGGGSGNQKRRVDYNNRAEEHHNMVSVSCCEGCFMVWRKEYNSYKKSAFTTPRPRGKRMAWRRPITNKVNAEGGAIRTRVGRMHINLAEVER